MSYISISFFVFLLLTAVIYFALPLRLRPWVLLTASAFFYLLSGLGNFVYITCFILLTYTLSRLIERAERGRTALFLLYLLLGGGSWVFIKYVPPLLNFFGFTVAGARLVPLGLSFFTLQGVAYVVDIFRGKQPCEHSLPNLALFLSYFPLIVQGPISRYEQLGVQLREGHRFDYDSFKFGLQLALWGVFKKLVIANRAAFIVEAIFDHYTEYTGIVVVAGSLFYVIQLYADFSGCVDFCRGVSGIFGIELMNNFNHPYFATSVRDFWSRWHISLSHWLRDYIYFPLGGSRKGKGRKRLNLIAAFLVSGMWHGVGLNFIVWGLMHATYRILEDLIEPYRKKFATKHNIDLDHGWARIFSIFVTMIFVTYARVWFRAGSVAGGAYMTAAMFRDFWCWDALRSVLPSTSDLLVLLAAMLVFLAVSLLQEKMPIRKNIARLPLPLRWGIYLLGLFVVIVFGRYGSGYQASEFLYMKY